MKKIYILLFVSALWGTSCSDWLDVSPRSQVEEKSLFASEIGFKSAHIGVYLQIAEQSMYGRNANMFLADGLSCSWTVSASATAANNEMLYELSQMRYTNARVEGLISSVWIKHYAAIVQINNILENLEKSDLRFSFQNDKLIKGELLGLRAFLHLELLRLFGSEPGATEKVGIPYVTKMTKEIDLLTTKPYDEVVRLIEKDLSDAEELLGEVDMITKYSNLELDNSFLLDNKGVKYDEWQTKRQGRFNYYAVLATKARLYNWIGDKVNAVNYAKMVIDAENPNATTKRFPLITLLTFKDHALYAEHVFGLDNPKLSTNLQNTFMGREAVLSQDKDLINSAFGESTTDFRTLATGNYWVVTQHSGQTQIGHFLKYIGTNQHLAVNKVPMIRIAELYLIMTENLDLTSAKDYFTLFVNARGLGGTEVDVALATDETRLAMLEREYRRDFFGEGQMFFFYKRHNYTGYTWPDGFIVPTDAYVIPKPKDQIKFE